MKILALELSSEIRTVAVWDAADGRSGLAREERVRHTQVFALIERALAEAGCAREEIGGIVVGTGPGSYTGIRMAVAAAQGWHAATGVPLMGVSSVDCLAAVAHSQGRQGRIDCIVDAQRGEFYLAGYELGGEGWREIEPLHLAAAAEVEQRLASGGCVLGPDAAKAFRGAVDTYPNAIWLARMAAAKPVIIPPEQLQPIYLRAISFVKAPPSRILQ